jgi:lysozyme
MKRIFYLFVLILLPLFLVAQPKVYNGIDVSSHQGDIDWKVVAKDKNIEYVYIKATEGSTYQDKKYKYNLKEARKHGLKVGSYHFLTSKSPIRKQFENFKKMASKETQDLIPMLDVEGPFKEWTQEELQKNIQIFIDLCIEYYGKAPIIYGTMRSYNTYCAPRFNKYHLMIGCYGKNAPRINGTGHYSIWQYTDKARIRGISKTVDLSVFHKDYDINILLLKK